MKFSRFLVRLPVHFAWVVFGLVLFSLAACGGTPASEVAHTPEQSAAPAPHPFPEPQKLIGFTADQVTRLMQEPDFKRPEATAELWQYADETCAFSIYLYKNVQGQPEVRHIEARGRNGETVTTTDCLYSLLVGPEPR